MDNKSYNQALRDIRDKLAPLMQPSHEFDRYSVQVVQWKQIENKIEQLQKPEDDS